jgi:hypothetical protein
MEGPFDLTAGNIAKVREELGVYILGYYSGTERKDYGCYVGRSDDNVASRLSSWLSLVNGGREPQNDSERCVLKSNPDRYWREYTSTAKQAYERECEIYHEHGQGYECNDIHPAKSSQDWTCPVCDL